MASDPADPQPPSRKFILFPLFLVLVIAAAWSGGWVYAASKAETLIEATLAREAARGRTLACAAKSISGFPFRIEFDCVTPRLHIARGNIDASLEAAHLKAAAQIYNPRHIIAELAGPLRVRSPAGEGEANWQLAQASVILAPDEIEQIDVAADQLSIANGAVAVPIATAARAQAHARRAKDSQTRDFDVAVLASKLSLQDAGNGLPPQLAAIDRAELAGTVRALPQDISEDASASLRLWQQNDGRLDVTRLWLDTGEGAVLASGTLMLEASGRPSGAVTAALANPQALAGQAANGPLQLVMTAMQLLGKRVEVEGRKAVEIDIALSDGLVRIGPATLGPLPPLY